MKIKITRKKVRKVKLIPNKYNKYIAGYTTFNLLSISKFLTNEKV